MGANLGKHEVPHPFPEYTALKMLSACACYTCACCEFNKDVSDVAVEWTKTKSLLNNNFYYFTLTALISRFALAGSILVTLSIGAGARHSRSVASKARPIVS